jgi:hypothetical protein
MKRSSRDQTSSDPEFVPSEAGSDGVAVGETAAGLEVDTAASSDEVPLERSELKVRKKFKTSARGPGRGAINYNFRLPREQWRPLGALRSLPSALKQETDRLAGDKTEQRVTPQLAAVLRELQERVRRLTAEGREGEAAALLQEMCARPDHFWSGGDMQRGYRCRDDTWQEGKLSHFFAWEEVGLAALELAEGLEDRGVRLGLVRQLAVQGEKYRQKLHLSRVGQVQKPNKYFRKIPKTSIRCAEILLAEGDVKGLAEMFEGFVANSSNAADEAPLQVLRSVSAMLDRKVQEDEDGRSVSHLSTSGTSFTSGLSGRGNNLTVDHMRRALLAPGGAELEWTARLFAWYLLEERDAEGVLEVLVQYRDHNMDHLPCHTPLIEFLDREYTDEVEVRLRHLACTADQFPWDPCVLTYCSLKSKQAEEKDDDEEVEFSFDSGEEMEEEERTADRAGRLTEKIQALHDTRLEIVKRLLDFLDYEQNSPSTVAWSTLGAALLSLVRAGHGRAVGDLWGEDRAGWWWDQHFSSLATEERELVAGKGSVAGLLAGPDSPRHLAAATELERRRAAIDSPALSALLAQLRAAGRAGTPCIGLGAEQRYSELHT